MPLAIEFAAACVSILTVDEIAARLDDRFRLLQGTVETLLSALYGGGFSATVMFAVAGVAPPSTRPSRSGGGSHRLSVGQPRLRG